MAGTTTKSTPSTAKGSDSRDVIVAHNSTIDDIARLLAAHVGDGNITVATPTIGTTVTVAIPTTTIQINGVPVLLAALTAQAFGGLGTIPASKFGVIGMERVAAGTCTFTSGAANYSTGYDTAAAALAALPAQSADKVLVGHLVIGASGSGWVAGTDALAGGSGGTPATSTVYYPGVSLYDASLYTGAKIGDRAGTVVA